MFGIVGIVLIGLLAALARWVDSSNARPPQRERLGATDGAHLQKAVSR
jgi:hypothetical protein